jgi:hypothetical protein
MIAEQPQDPVNRVPTGVELTALDPTFRTDPYPVLARLRERESVHCDAVIKRWVLTRGDDIDRVLRDRTMAVDGRQANEGPRAVELLAPRIRAIIDALLDGVTGQESFDLIEAFAGPLPVIVIAEMLGVDPNDRDDFKRWSDLTVMGLNPRLTKDQRERMAEARRQLDAYLQRAIADRRASPTDDLISRMRFPNLRLADEALEWRAIPGFRGPVKLRVWVEARRP